MIKTFCDNVVSVFTHCSSVVKIYANCQEVWTADPGPGYWYISWTPTDLSGTFSMFSGVEYFQDFSGYYSWSGSSLGYIPDGTFYFRGSSNKLSTVETNVKSIGYRAFAYQGDGTTTDYGSLSFVKASKCEDIGVEAFAYCNRITDISFPKCKNVGASAFFYCRRLPSLSLPNCEYIADHAFRECVHISTINLPKCTSIGSYAFESCYSLVDISLPKLSIIPDHCFIYNSGLSRIEPYFFPECTYIGSGAFESCIRLRTINLSKCSYISLAAFEGCRNLSDVSLPACEFIGVNAFYNASISSVILPNAREIYGSAFYRSGTLARFSLYLPGSYIVDMWTPIGPDLTTIYVPSSLYRTYRSSHTGDWFSNRFASIPESFYSEHPDLRQ